MPDAKQLPYSKNLSAFDDVINFMIVNSVFRSNLEPEQSKYEYFFIMKEETLMIYTLYLVTESTKSSLFTVNNREFDRFSAKHETHKECLQF